MRNVVLCVTVMFAKPSCEGPSIGRPGVINLTLTQHPMSTEVSEAYCWVLRSQAATTRRSRCTVQSSIRAAEVLTSIEATRRNDKRISQDDEGGGEGGGEMTKLMVQKLNNILCMAWSQNSGVLCAFGLDPRTSSKGYQVQRDCDAGQYTASLRS